MFLEGCYVELLSEQVGGRQHGFAIVHPKGETISKRLLFASSSKVTNFTVGRPNEAHLPQGFSHGPLSVPPLCGTAPVGSLFSIVFPPFFCFHSFVGFSFFFPFSFWVLLCAVFSFSRALENAIRLWLRSLSASLECDVDVCCIRFAAGPSQWGLSSDCGIPSLLLAARNFLFGEPASLSWCKGLGLVRWATPNCARRG